MKNTFEELKAVFKTKFNEDADLFFSAPGRTELGGNHTDHQHGIVLAAAINLDSKAAVKLNNKDYICIDSDGFEEIKVELNDLSLKEEEKGTSISLVRGILSKIKELGGDLKGFNACIFSSVLQGSGLSSSASFEVLIATIINYFSELYLDQVEIAKISQYAENVYYGKPCGLMDQTASAVGAVVSIDFKDNTKPVINKINYDFDNSGYTLFVIDSGASHADLTKDYADITIELKQVCNFFNKNYLREVDEKEFYDNFEGLRKQVGDRAMLRAIHVFDENKRALNEAKALENNDFVTFLKIMNESGESSWKYLQNIIPSGRKENQELALAIALCKKLLNGKGACRVHGGGFAGTLQVFVPNDMKEEFKEKIEKALGQGCCHILKIRQEGGIKVNL